MAETQDPKPQTPDAPKEGGIAPVMCSRCGSEIKPEQSSEQHPEPEGRTHNLQTCFDNVKGELDTLTLPPASMRAEKEAESKKKTTETIGAKHEDPRPQTQDPAEDDDPDDTKASSGGKQKKK